MLLFFVRHGDPIYDPDSLTELGHKQAEVLVQRMKVCNPDRIFASSSNRAIATALPTAKHFNIEIEIMDWCNEFYAFQELGCLRPDGSRTWCFSDSEIREFFASKELRSMDKNWYLHPKCKEIPGAKLDEGIQRIQKETDAFMMSLGYEHDASKNGYFAKRPNNERIALFAHQGFGTAFLSCLLDIPYPLYSTHFDMGHSGVTVIEFSGEGFVIPTVLQMSNDSHIFSAGIDTVYQNRIRF